MTLGNCIVRSVAAGATLFALRWAIYGSLLEGSLLEPSGVAEDPIRWAIVAGSLLSGGLLTLVLDWKVALGAAEGAKAGAGFGLVMELAYGTMAHGTMMAGPALGDVIRDGLVALVMYGIAGAVVGALAGYSEGF